MYFSLKNYKTQIEEQKVLVHVTLDHDLHVAKFDVDLDSLPNIYLDGYEVVTQFTASDFDQKGVFYTDSNGLEMQKRILNYRSYYNITQDMYLHNGQNITANYYPINSAIAIKDTAKNTQFTVSNSRSQGGSALYPGQIQLMQNRRIPCDDGKGENDFLNETDSDGSGLRVRAAYFVQIHSLEERASEQRKVQQKLADPLVVGYGYEAPKFTVKSSDASPDFDVSSDELKTVYVP